jgi:hypothetical protein
LPAKVGAVSRGSAGTPNRGGVRWQSWRAYVLPIVALLLFALTVSLILLAAGQTLGYDYLCYEGAARAVSQGRPMYDNAFSISIGTCPGTYTYPPPFAVALVPLLNLGGAAPGVWCLAMAACFLAGVALLPVRSSVRWSILVLAAFDWPLLYAIKLGQVGPILFLVFAAAWRWIDRAGPFGVACAVGTLVKVQPGLVVIWAFATRRRRAAVTALAVGAIAAALALPFAGLADWMTYSDLIRGLAGTYGIHDVAPGAVAFHAGASAAAANAVQVGSIAVAAAGLLVAWRFTSPAVSLQVTFVASQILSSPLRDHYALLLLIPTAWLLDRGRRWAIVFPLSGWIALYAVPVSDSAAATSVAAGSVNWVAASSIPLAFFGCLAVLLWEGFRERRATATFDAVQGAGFEDSSGLGAILDS